jgi:hypothetical protein
MHITHAHLDASSYVADVGAVVAGDDFFFFFFFDLLVDVSVVLTVDDSFVDVVDGAASSRAGGGGGTNAITRTRYVHTVHKTSTHYTPASLSGGGITILPVDGTRRISLDVVVTAFSVVDAVGDVDTDCIVVVVVAVAVAVADMGEVIDATESLRLVNL